MYRLTVASRPEENIAKATNYCLDGDELLGSMDNKDPLNGKADLNDESKQ